MTWALHVLTCNFNYRAGTHVGCCPGGAMEAIGALPAGRENGRGLDDIIIFGAAETLLGEELVPAPGPEMTVHGNR